MDVHNIKTGDWKENCFIVDDKNHHALIVDPGDNFIEISAFLDENQLTPIAIINTHAHFDHVGAVAQLKEKYSIKFFLHKKEVPLLKRANLYKAAFMGKGNIALPMIDGLIDDDITNLDIGPFNLIIHHTPGHTNGGICIQIENYLFTGDTLLSSNLIPKKLPEENPALLRKSLEYLKTLDAQLINLPGHGMRSELGLQVDHLLSKWAPI
jgi:hydroxyacylglutathione hydrolase